MEHSTSWLLENSTSTKPVMLPLLSQRMQLK
jgi:hypothetical protein